MGIIVSAVASGGSVVLRDMELPYPEYRRRRERRDKRLRGTYDLSGHYVPIDKKDEKNYMESCREREKEEIDGRRSVSPNKRAVILSPPGSRPPHRPVLKRIYFFIQTFNLHLVQKEPKICSMNCNVTGRV